MSEEPNRELERGAFATVAGVVESILEHENGWRTVLVSIPPEDVNLLDLPQAPPGSWFPPETRGRPAE